MMRIVRHILPPWLTMLLLVLAAAGLVAAGDKTSWKVEVSGQQGWKDTRVDVKPGDKLLITATGMLRYLDAPMSSGPDGLQRSWADLLRRLPVGEAGRGTLIGRIGEGDAAQPFRVGARRELIVTQAGRLFLYMNQAKNDSPDGSYQVTIELLERGKVSGNAASAAPVASSATGKIPETPIPIVNDSLLDRIPRRVSDKENHPGDMVNFLVLGTEDQVRQVFEAAGWVKVDKSPKEALLHGLLATLSKEDYLTMPMSELYLFGRTQDYGFAHAEPLSVVASRNHLRIWKAPFQVNGRELWCGAATHDVGIERDERNNGITHKIDPNIDLEREYVAQTLYSTGLVKQLTHFLPENPLREARTATGGRFYSDGRILVMDLGSEANDASHAFADFFCSVLHEENPDGGEWGACTNYIFTPGREDLALAALPSNYRVLIVPGVFHSCTSSTPAYKNGQEYLRSRYRMDVEYFSVPDDSSDVIAGQLANYLREHRKKDSRKYVVVGYSKGAPDVQVALAKYPDVVSSVAALVTVSGAVYGSPIAEALPAQFERYMKELHLGKCEGDFSAAFKSLRQDVRKAFLESYPDPAVPTFSLAAVSDKSTTSKLMLQSWELLSVFGSEHDGQVLKDDALVPGAVRLGSVRADHFAVALPLDNGQNPQISSLLNHNRFPRAALLEAMVRYVVQSLQPQTQNRKHVPGARDGRPSFS